MGNQTINQDQGHWLLAKMGKKVLRPGGRAMTLRMIKELNIKNTDDIVEFAPGVGYTAELAWQKQPHSYTGIELNAEAAANLRRKINGANKKIVEANAAKTGLKDNSKDIVFGEAMLTMQADHRKSEIIREAARILKPGGYYAIHELGLKPDELPETQKNDIQKGMAKAIKVNARPMTAAEWKKLLEDEGFIVLRKYTTSMDLLKTGRIIADEGLWRSLKIGYNIMTHKQERARILEMYKTFKKYENHLNAVTFIARKNKMKPEA